MNPSSNWSMSKVLVLVDLGPELALVQCTAHLCPSHAPVLQTICQVEIRGVVESSVAEQLPERKAWVFGTDWLLTSALIIAIGFHGI